MTEVLVDEGSGYAVLQDSPEESVRTISGVAIGEGDVTRGQSGILKRWPAAALREAADTLEDKPLVIDHRNHEVEKVKGQITKAGYKSGVGVIFEGEIENGEIAEKIENGWLDVSPRILHEPVEEMEVEGEADDPVHIVGEVKEFVNLSLVSRGAAPSNEVTIGEHEELSGEAVRRFVTQAITDSLADSDESAVDVSVDVSVPSESLSDGYSRVLSDLKFDEGDTSSEAEESEESGATEESEVDEDELEEHSIHEPSFSGATEASWSKPSLEDFTDESWEDLSSDEKSDIGDHFIGSKSGFPADNFGDFFLPVVNAGGNLNLNALQNAKARVGQVSGLSDEDQSRAETIINRLAEENFDADFEDNSEESEEEESEKSVLMDVDFLGDDDSHDGTSTEDIAKLPILN